MGTITAADFVTAAAALIAEYPTASAHNLAPMAWERAGGGAINLSMPLHLTACAIVAALQVGEVGAAATLIAQLDERLQRYV